MISADALDELKGRHPCDAYAAQWVKLRRHGRKMVGPCPICSADPASRTATRFEADANGWVCAVCCDGGDVIRLAARVNGLDPERDFRKIVDILGGARDVDPATAAAAAKERQERAAQREREAAAFREKERRRLWQLWQAGIDWHDTPVDSYLALRLGDRLPRAVALPRLRYLADAPLFADGSTHAKLVHRGPAMLAAITGLTGKFAGLHFTYIDLASPNSGKLFLAHPDKPEELLPSKKVRGSKAGGRIELIRKPDPHRLIVGEGIEKVLAVWMALGRAGRDLSTTAFWSSIDLGNLGGRAHKTVAHPTLKTSRGQAQRVPGPKPDLIAPAMPLPDSVRELVLLGDSTSDRFLTECAIARARTRYALPDRAVRAAWAPDGKDFDDVLRDRGGNVFNQAPAVRGVLAA